MKNVPAKNEQANEESVYNAADLIAVAETGFGVAPELMAGALHAAGLRSATRMQAVAALTAFRTLEV